MGWWDRLTSAWPPFHEEIDAVVVQRGKAKPLVQVLGAVEFFHVDAKGFVTTGCLSQESLQNGGADAGLPVFWQERDIDPKYFIRSPFDVESPNWAVMAEDDSEVGHWKLSQVGLLLGSKLHSEKGLMLRFAPTQGGQFIQAGAGVDLEEKPFVLWTDGAEGDPFSVLSQDLFIHLVVAVG